ncbi:MAG: Stp1/IreP family PP2C-type Ser/Thr phosphatase [Flavobacteriaceae bacterium]|nr:Stp1/IreP family PP2C-type Ser/Thr phosphatase [Flavobacteriaceae bacterium]
MSLKFIYSETTHKGNIRKENEDSCQIAETPNGTLFVICDGMGGAAEGKKASNIAVASIVEFFNKTVHENLQIALYNALAFANEQIYATAQMYPAYKGMGTTACVVLLYENSIYFAHVGDSRIYLHTNKQLFQLTKDHSFVNQLVDQGTITIEESKTHQQKNRILKALGVHQKVEPTISSEPLLLKKHDTLIICSDGLNDMVADQNIKSLIETEATLLQKTENLLNKALENGGKDNITIQTIQILESPYIETVFKDKTLYLESNEPILVVADENLKKKRIKMLAIILIPLFLLGIFLMVNNKNETIEEEYCEEEQKAETSVNNTDELDKTNNITLETKNNTIDEILDTEINEKENLINKKIPDYIILGEKTDVKAKTIETLSELKSLFNIDTLRLQKINKWSKDYNPKKGDTIFLTKKDYDKYILNKKSSKVNNKK